MEHSEKGERVAKRIARAGVCSRREAERLIEAGGVTVNGQCIKSPAMNVLSGDVIQVRGKPLPVIEEARLWLYYKPLGLVTTHKDEQGRKTVFASLPAHLPRLISVGRLDLNTEGLLLLTNSGTLSRYLELPSTGWKRRYKARIYGLKSLEPLQTLAKGITIDGIRYGSIEVTVENTEKKGTNSWIVMTLSEGKNREIRRVLEHIGCKVSRLIRVSYGPFQLGNLSPDEIREVPRKTLAEQLGGMLDGLG